MKAFTVLDVVQYENCKNHNVTLRELLKYFIIKVMNASEQECIRTELQHFPSWISVSYKASTKIINKELITIDIKIVEGEWHPHECIWIRDKLEGMLKKIKLLPWLFGGFDDYKLSHPNEIFFTFCEILRQKFPNDLNLHCIMDDLIRLIKTHS